MPPNDLKSLLLIELLETEQTYSAATMLANFEWIIDAQGGKLVNAVGKKIVCSLNDPNLAAETACQLISSDYPGKTTDQPVIRICVCLLPTGADSKEAQSQAIAAAVRELAKANPGQIVATQDTAELLSAQFEIKYGSPTGKTGVRVFEILLPARFRQNETTRLASVADRTGKKLRLRWRLKDQTNKEMVLYSGHTTIAFGRDENNDIVIDSGMASRRHGQVEYRNGSLYLIDNSTNGTFVFPEVGAKFKVHKGEKLVPPRGYFCLGEELDADHSHSVQFVTVFSAG
ncbi:MAG: FHA domain-containing protein [Sulfuricella sp.]|nr:FHA domain-containing protein [Sulfuricella sp.]